MPESENDMERAREMADAMDKRMTEVANMRLQAKRVEEAAEARDDASGGHADTAGDYEEASLLRDQAAGQEIVANAVGDAAGARFDKQRATEIEEARQQISEMSGPPEDETRDPEDYEHLDPNA